MTTIHERSNQLYCTSGYMEEEWVDFVLGKLSHAKRQQLESHLESCAVCRQQMEEWSAILTAKEHMLDATGQEQVSSFYKNEREASTVDAVMPEQKYLLSLQRMVKRQARMHQLKRKLKEQKYILAGAAAALLLLAITLKPLNDKLVTPAHVDDYVLHYEPNAASFVNAVDSARYRVETAEGQTGSGYIWLKEDWSEVFLWLENLPVIERQDYQAWAVSGEVTNSLGIIQTVGSEGHLYIQTPYQHPTDFISITVEPKGGSLVPTSKQIVLIVKQK